MLITTGVAYTVYVSFKHMYCIIPKMHFTTYTRKCKWKVSVGYGSCSQWLPCERIQPTTPVPLLHHMVVTSWS